MASTAAGKQRIPKVAKVGRGGKVRSCHGAHRQPWPIYSELDLTELILSVCFLMGKGRRRLEILLLDVVGPEIFRICGK